MQITLYGIPNCDKVKKARQWLTSHEIDYSFYNYKTNGVPEILLRTWHKKLGWENLINQRGTTWKKLPLEKRQSLDFDSALTLIQEQPSLIKRPIVEIGNSLSVGYSEQQFEELFLS